MSKIIKFGVVTVSDTCYEDQTKDSSGPRLAQLLRDTFQNADVLTAVVPDEQIEIQIIIKKLCAGGDVACIITTGGTGFAPRDVTPEATIPLLEKQCPQLAVSIALGSLKKTKFAALTRGVCGIRRKTLILNFPGSEKAVVECFEVVRDLLPHALSLISEDLALVRRVHDELHGDNKAVQQAHVHVCPHETGAGDDSDRNSPFPMLAIEAALNIIRQTVEQNGNLRKYLSDFNSPVNIPPFRASIKDGYAMKSSGFSGTKKVIGYISAGDALNTQSLQEDECFKINTGAPVPVHADCVIQIEDTKLLQRNKNGEEDLVEILVEPKTGLDIRPIGCDLPKGSKVFPAIDHSPVVVKSLLASVGEVLHMRKPKIALISTGSELLAPKQQHVDGKIFDSNTTMLEELLGYFGYDCMRKLVLTDDFATVSSNLSQLFESVDFVICTGGVSMGDKDYIKPVLEQLKFTLHFGRVNMKPGKPMTFASKKNKYFFGLPGNPVSAFVTFHLFALPAIRYAAGWDWNKCVLPIISVKLENASLNLDPRPEFVRASVTSKNGVLYASVNGDQMSSRLQSIVGADVLVHLPARTTDKQVAKSDETYKASVLRYDFISKYENGINYH